MKAAKIEAYGDVGQINVGDRPSPSPGHGEVIVNVRAAALNHLDIWVRMGTRGDAIPMPHILGSDAAGVVAEMGEGVNNVSVGDEVIVNPGISCGACEWCLRGEQSECADYSILGRGHAGTFAEQTAVSATSLLPKPSHLSFEEAAALPLAHLTAWRMLMSRGAMRPGETVLIHGIGGGVALAALQFATQGGGEVFVTSSSDDKLAKAKGLGAAYGVNYRSADVAAEVKGITKGRGVDLIIDTVGAATWPINFGCIRRGGRIVHCGVTTGAEATVNLAELFWNHVSVIGSTMGSHEEFRAMVRTVEVGRLKPVIDKVYPLVEVQRATTRMEAGDQFGKIVLSIA
jgi:NADPH:quinone reductase-like Zn-dependent oxidoreductase